jgi:hypothetical protein
VSAPSSPSASSSRHTSATMSVGYDDSESSDLTSYYCIGCDSRHELGSGALLSCVAPSTPPTRESLVSTAISSLSPRLGLRATRSVSPLIWRPEPKPLLATTLRAPSTINGGTTKLAAATSTPPL